jgi:hypothetical protein
MFEHLGEFNRILVSGPQRSGTTLIARAIWQDTGLEYVDEQEFSAVNEAEWRAMVQLRENFVMQCPGMCRYIHEFGQEDDLAVVMCHRPIADIITSQERIGWEWEKYELLRYDLSQGVIAEVKYGYWNEVQKRSINNAFDVYYSHLDQHPLWIPQEQRADFNRRQWKL